MVEDYGLVAESAHLFCRVRDKKHRYIVFKHRHDPFLALCSETGIADGEHLVEDKHLRVNRGGYRKAETRAHTGGIVLDRYMHKVLELGKLDYLIVALLDVLSRIAHSCAVEIDVFLACIVHIKARAELEQRGDNSPCRDRALCGLENTRNGL